MKRYIVALIPIILGLSCCERKKIDNHHAGESGPLYELTVWGSKGSLAHFFKSWRPIGHPYATKLESLQNGTDVYLIHLDANTESEGQRAIAAARQAGIDYRLRVGGRIELSYD